jgi:hypothetical protein
MGVATDLRTMNEQMTYVGYRERWGADPVLFGISAPDRRQHIYVIGKTGSGKTTLLRNLIVQHLAAGDGVGLIDPHGDLSEELLNHFPPSRADDLVYFNPADVENPVGFNPLANVRIEDRHLVASGVVAALKGIWRDSWGPRLEYLLYNAVAALLDRPNTSLLGVNRMFVDARYRDWVLSQTTDPFVRSFWKEEYENYDPRFQREAIAPIQNKLGQFLTSSVIRNILGQVRCKFSIPFMMNDGRVFIANLAKGKLSADKANLLGSLLATQFQLAAMSRASLPENDRRDFYLFIDEFQNFTTDAFASILSEARKYRLCLTLSHQYIEQIPVPIQQAVFGNVGTLIAFRVGHVDADALTREFGQEFIAEQFVDLNQYEVLVRAVENGKAAASFRGNTLPPIENQIGRREKVIARSRQRYGAERQSIEAKLNRWMTNWS